jgi:trimethylamine:corrinoid methyltransferase-like protein
MEVLQETGVTLHDESLKVFESNGCKVNYEEEGYTFHQVCLKSAFTRHLAVFDLQ